MMLTQPRFAAARQFLEEQGRALEFARFRYYFEAVPADAVLAALAAFQNPDGGFGHGLEADVRTPDSSVICTTIALQILRSLAVPPDHPLWVAGMDFLLRAYNPATQHWRNIPLSAEQSPHAPWWSQADEPDAYDEFELNPTAEVLGYLYDDRDRVPTDLINTVTDRVLNTVLALDRIEMHELLCCIRLTQTAGLPDPVRLPLMTKLSALVLSAVDQNPADWASYGLRPLQIVDHPDSPFAKGLETAIEANLDYEIASQTESGAWEPTWSWADDFPEAWTTAHREWSGVLTLEKLLALKRFGRIEKARG